MINFVPVTRDDNNKFSARLIDNMAQMTMHNFNERITEVLEHIKPILDGDRSGKRGLNTAESALQSVLKIQQDLEAHKAKLEHELSSLELVLDKARSTVFDTYVDQKSQSTDG